MPRHNYSEGSEIIFSYTRAQAIADGVLIDVTNAAKNCGFRIPVAITNTIWSRWIEATPEQEEYGQSTEARLRDVLTVLFFRIRSLPKDTSLSRIVFTVRFLMDPEHDFYETPELTADCGPGDAAEPVITILLPEWDD